MKQAEWYLCDGNHPHALAEGWEVSRKAVLELLETFKTPVNPGDHELLKSVARTSLRTKIAMKSADQLAEIVVAAVQRIRKNECEQIDIFMVEIMHMKHKLETENRLIDGLVLDHGSRHQGMPKRLENCYILNCNISLEYERSEINSSFLYSNSNQREKMIAMEREVVDSKVRKIVNLKRTVCNAVNKSFVVINQKGIDPISLDMLAREGILALRRTKRRNAERLQLSCGGYFINSVEELFPDCLGFAGLVQEYISGCEKYTFIEDVKHKHSVTILIKAPSDLIINQIKEAVRDGLRSVKNVIEDGYVILGAGAFEIAASSHLMKKTRLLVKGKVKLGVDSFAHALLGIPKILAENSGFDAQESTINLIHEQANGRTVGLDISSGKPVQVQKLGIYDNYSVKKQIILNAPVISSQLLLVDEIIRVGPNNC
jgi:T-complex protein 1 subunit zeta